MFSKEVSCYLSGLQHKTIKVGRDELKGTVLSYRVEPFTLEMANDLGSEIRGVAFRRTDGAEVNPNIESASFVFAPKPQRVDIFADRGMDASVTLIEAKVGKFKIRRVKDASHLALTFTVTVAELSGDELLYLRSHLFEQRYVTFEDAQPGLFAQAEAEARRESKEAKPVKRGRKPAENREEGVEHARTLPRRRGRKKALDTPPSSVEATH